MADASLALYEACWDSNPRASAVAWFAVSAIFVSLVGSYFLSMGLGRFSGTSKSNLVHDGRTVLCLPLRVSTNQSNTGTILQWSFFSPILCKVRHPPTRSNIQFQYTLESKRSSRLARIYPCKREWAAAARQWWVIRNSRRIPPPTHSPKSGCV